MCFITALISGLRILVYWTSKKKKKKKKRKKKVSSLYFYIKVNRNKSDSMKKIEKQSNEFIIKESQC